MSASVVGAVNHTRPHKLRNSYRNHYESKGLPAKRHSTQFKVSPSGQLPMGTSNLIFFCFFCLHPQHRWGFHTRQSLGKRCISQRGAAPLRCDQCPVLTRCCLLCFALVGAPSPPPPSLSLSVLSKVPR